MQKTVILNISMIGCLLLICLNSCSQQPPKALSTNNIVDSTLKKSSVIPTITDTTFIIEPRKNFYPSYDSLSFEIEEPDSVGIYTFRGNNQRNSPVRGILRARPSEIIEEWRFNTGYDTTKGSYGLWGGGAGWTGQPLYVQWSGEEIKDLSNLMPEFRNRITTLNEIVQVSLAGKVYFIEMETGKQTRKPLEINNPVKGTPSIDGKNRRYILVGQGIQNRGSFGWRAFDLRKQTLLHTEPMPSGFAYKFWGANDASPLIDAKSGIFIWPTESGIIYRGILDKNKLDSTEQYRYNFPEHPRQGIESSPSAYKSLGYFTDNGGNIICVDLRNMKPRWHFFNTDDSDGSPVIEVQNDTSYILIGNEVDQQGSSGKSYLRKLNGFTGKVVWEYERDCYNVVGEKSDNGGMFSTPLIGAKKAKGLIWTNFSRVDKYGKGAFVCINDSTGLLKYEIKFSQYSWVSPIALYDPEGNAYIYFADVGGNIFLIEGETGEIIFRKNLGLTFEASPIAIGDRIIQPARGNKILSFKVR